MKTVKTRNALQQNGALSLLESNLEIHETAFTVLELERMGHIIPFHLCLTFAFHTRSTNFLFAIDTAEVFRLTSPTETHKPHLPAVTLVSLYLFATYFSPFHTQIEKLN